MALPQSPQERDQGAVTADEQLAAGAPAPLEPTPTQADQGLVPNLGTAIPDMGTVAENATTATGRQPNMWRIPTNYAGVLGNQPVSPVQQNENLGYLWKALMANPNASPLTRMIAETLLGGGSKRGAI